jgi:hypothetical protein
MGVPIAKSYPGELQFDMRKWPRSRGSFHG